MEINLLFLFTVVPAIILYGIAKSGLGGSMTLISIPLMTIVMPLNQALGIILPILIFSDFIAVYKYRKEYDLGTLKLMVPFAAVGIIIASFFPGIAYTMILYITGLTGVSREMIEAGRIDGASGFTMLWNVVLPQLKPATLIAVVVTIVGSLRSFDLIAVMTAGGPWGSSEVLAYKMYQESLFNYRMGYGAAIATILFLIMDIYIAWFLYRLFKNERSEK